MALAECSASGILSTQTHARALNYNRTKRNRFGERPINRQLTRTHFGAPRELAHHLRIDMEVLRHNRDFVSDGFDEVGAYRSFYYFRAVEFRNDNDGFRRVLLRRDLFGAREAAS